MELTSSVTAKRNVGTLQEAIDFVAERAVAPQATSFDECTVTDIEIKGRSRVSLEDGKTIEPVYYVTVKNATSNR